MAYFFGFFGIGFVDADEDLGDDLFDDLAHSAAPAGPENWSWSTSRWPRPWNGPVAMASALEETRVRALYVAPETGPETAPETALETALETAYRRPR
jgi:hypothetical protein